MEKINRSRRDLAAMKARRLKAAKMFAAGRTQADVARTLGVSRMSTSRWHRDWQQGGSQALHGAGRVGRRPRLNDRQLQEVEQALRRGPQSFGYETQLWTLPRLAEVIKRLTGVRFHPGHVWKLLHALDWSL